jgi:hypothetical protein
MQFSDADWLGIAALAGGLPNAALDEIKPLVQRYHEGRDKDFEVRNWVTKRQIKKALALTEELLGELGTLAQDSNYKCFNTAGKAVNDAPLEDARDALGRLHSTLTQARDRFVKPSTRVWSLKRETKLLRELLEIQHRYLKTDLPVRATERAEGPRFRQYLGKCIGLSGPPLDRWLDPVIDEFARRAKSTRRRCSG